jgi:CubicO group peptidase (beta-lactamase class C family)
MVRRRSHQYPPGLFLNWSLRLTPELLTALCLFAAAPALAWDATAGAADKSAQVDKLFSPWDRPDQPGCAVGIIDDGKLIYSKGFGSANLEHEAPNTPQTIFEIASASKSFTCACLALLMDQGKVDPDDELRTFVPEMHSFDPPIRIRHMVQCRTGLWEPFHIMPLVGFENLPIQNAYSQADLFTVLCGQRRLPFEPGSQFHYGSGDYYLLGLVVERVSGKSLAEFARDNLFQPLGMNRTYFEEDPSRVVKGRAVGYYREKEVWRHWRVNAALPGGGGVNTCVEDLYLWDQNFQRNRLPSGKYLNEFLRTGTLLDNRHVLDADAYRKYVQAHAKNSPPGEYRGLKRIQFTGGVWGMTAAISRFPEQKFTVICLSNNDELSPFAKTREIAELFLSDRMAPHPLPSAGDERRPVEVPRADLEDKSGAYRLVSEGRIWKVEIRDGALHIVDPMNEAWKLEPLGSTRFRPQAGTRFYKSARFSFHRAAPGERYAMTLESYEHGFHEVLNFEPVELAEVSPAALTEYEGAYVSDELSATYRFAVRDNALWLRVGSRRWERFDPTVRDEFIPHDRTLHDNRIITFRRDSQGNIADFSIAFWRVSNVNFQKESDAP